ncbi:hypothetical protein PAT3040_02022 [Paenibacillus agaridevorans]|uniref:Uncharacterized protein n=1 Tax=Paenibacillus agaridevorans TaxID=171404 RepID=A0A2R5EVP5_9BACL|nr:hypothetical protein PAT3040_02022 [Paenibacillus agaridevorans]
MMEPPIPTIPEIKEPTNPIANNVRIQAKSKWVSSFLFFGPDKRMRSFMIDLNTLWGIYMSKKNEHFTIFIFPSDSF